MTVESIEDQQHIVVAEKGGELRHGVSRVGRALAVTSQSLAQDPGQFAVGFRNVEQKWSSVDLLGQRPSESGLPHPRRTGDREEWGPGELGHCSEQLVPPADHLGLATRFRQPHLPRPGGEQGGIMEQDPLFQAVQVGTRIESCFTEGALCCDECTQRFHVSPFLVEPQHEVTPTTLPEGLLLGEFSQACG